MNKKLKIVLTISFCISLGVFIGRIIQPGEIVWKYVQDINVDNDIQLEIIAPNGWNFDERWRIYTLDMDVDPSSSKRPVIAMGHDGSFDLALFEGARHDHKIQVIETSDESSDESSDRALYKVSINSISEKPTRLWLWSGGTGYRFIVNGTELKERKSWRLTKENPHFYYVLRKNT